MKFIKYYHYLLLFLSLFHSLTTYSAVFKPKGTASSTVIFNSKNSWKNTSKWEKVSGSSALNYPISGDVIQFGSLSEYGKNPLRINFDLTSLGYTNLTLSSNSHNSELYIGKKGRVSVETLERNNIMKLSINEGGVLTVANHVTLQDGDNLIVKGTLNLNDGLEFTGGGTKTISSSGQVNIDGDFIMESTQLNITGGDFNITGDWLIPKISGSNALSLTGGTMRIDGTIDIVDGSLGSIDTTGGRLVAGSCSSSSTICDALDAVLPVNLISLNGEYINDQFTILWETASEQNSKSFEIEASYDQRTWKVIGYVTASGNSQTNIKYEYKVNNVKYPFYRLVQYDFDGQFEYLGIVAKERVNNGIKVSIFPTLIGSKRECKIIFFNMIQDSKLHIQLYSYQGEMLIEEYRENVTKNTNFLKLKIPEQVRSGVYILSLKVGNKAFRNKLVLQ